MKGEKILDAARGALDTLNEFCQALQMSEKEVACVIMAVTISHVESIADFAGSKDPEVHRLGRRLGSVLLDRFRGMVLGLELENK